MIIDNIAPKPVRGSVGLMLREERLARGLSFEQAADAARVSYRYMHRLERGKGYYFVFFKRLLALYNKQVNIEHRSRSPPATNKALFERRAFIMFEK
ncbi:unknown [Proteobacteria bacterium CAG:495]|nr:unknown [Proteobacteria bacterium CAG:495]